MNVKELLKAGGFKKGQRVEFHEAHGCYDGTDLHVRYLRMDKTVDGTELVLLSNAVADKLEQCDPEEKVTFFLSCTVSFVPADGTYCDFWRIQMSDSTKVCVSLDIDFD